MLFCWGLIQTLYSVCLELLGKTRGQDPKTIWSFFLPFYLDIHTWLPGSCPVRVSTYGLIFMFLIIYKSRYLCVSKLFAKNRVVCMRSKCFKIFRDIFAEYWLQSEIEIIWMAHFYCGLFQSFRNFGHLSIIIFVLSFKSQMSNYTEWFLTK